MLGDRFRALLCHFHSVVSDLLHLCVIVSFSRELFRIGVVSESGNGGIGNHDGLEVEATVAEVSVKQSEVGKARLLRYLHQRVNVT